MLYNQGQAVRMANQATAPSKVRAKIENMPTPVNEDEILDWDCALETPPPSRGSSSQIVVTLRNVQISPSAI